MKRNPTQPTTTAPAALWEARLCLEWKYHGGPFGVLATEPGQPSRPVAFLFAAEEESRERDAALLQNAERVLREPWAINSGAFHAIDLRDVGRPDARRAVPAWMFGLLLRPILDGKATDVPCVAFRPSCPFLMNEMRAAAAK
jgi:hypothetical protein